MSGLDVHPNDLAKVQKILLEQVPEVDVYAFGSRVTGKAGKASDLDLVIMTQKPLETMRLANLREAFSDSDLPFKVDIVDWATTSESFRKIIDQDQFKIQTGNSR